MFHWTILVPSQVIFGGSSAWPQASLLIFRHISLCPDFDNSWTKEKSRSDTPHRSQSSVSSVCQCRPLNTSLQNSCNMGLEWLLTYPSTCPVRLRTWFESQPLHLSSMWPFAGSGDLSWLRVAQRDGDAKTSRINTLQ